MSVIDCRSNHFPAQIIIASGDGHDLFLKHIISDKAKLPDFLGGNFNVRALNLVL
tara:strand:- start:516 stop:680 length:165 start_codon:yes stop_codon:yes gene_type:complete